MLLRVPHCTTLGRYIAVVVWVHSYGPGSETYMFNCYDLVCIVRMLSGLCFFLSRSQLVQPPGSEEKGALQVAHGE